MHRIIHFCQGPPNQEFSGMLTCLFLLFMELNKGPIYMVNCKVYTKFQKDLYPCEAYPNW
ncbi:unnamed protein product [Rhodiola kirilowii]